MENETKTAKPFGSAEWAESLAARIEEFTFLSTVAIGNMCMLKERGEACEAAGLLDREEAMRLTLRLQSIFEQFDLKFDALAGQYNQALAEFLTLTTPECDQGPE